VVDGEVVASAAEERFSLQKHDPNFPALAAEFCLRHAGLDARELDSIVFYEEPHLKFSRVLSSCMAGYPGSRSSFVRSMKSWLTSKLWTRNEISRRFDVHPNRVDFVSHHLSHASQAFAASPFDESAILVVDAVGEWASTSLFHGRMGSGLELRELDVIPYPHSLGLVYAAFTAFLGFRVNDGECSTMALAAFGQPRYADKVRRVLTVEPGGSYRVDPSYFEFHSETSLPFSPKFLELFGQPRSFKDELPFDCMGMSSEPSKEHQYYADVAASIQLVLEEALLALCRRLKRETGAKNLCLAGGVALNCVANSRILAENLFEDVFIPPDPGDGGAASGAALHRYFSGGGARASGRSIQPYLGEAYDPATDLAMLDRLDGCFGSNRLEVENPSGEDRLAAGVARDLASGKVVGWFQGRFEAGPRALGNRSILIDPSNLEVARRMNQRVKARKAFRPYALSVAEEDASRVLRLPDATPRLMRWMQTSAPVRDSCLESVRAAAHIDGTTRPQICSSRENPGFHRLLKAMGEVSPNAALLNTSFNAGGFPLVSSPVDALLLFARTAMDVLVLENTVIRKAPA
jgi:carbamoyltransferase